MSLVLVRISAGWQGPIVLDVRPDLRVLGFAGMLSLFTSLLFGIGPALLASRLEVASLLKGNQNSSARNAMQGPRLGPTKILVIAQISMCLFLLVIAGLFVRTLKNLVDINPGFNPQQLLLFAVELPDSERKGVAGANLFEECLNGSKSYLESDLRLYRKKP